MQLIRVLRSLILPILRRARFSEEEKEVSSAKEEISGLRVLDPNLPDGDCELPFLETQEVAWRENLSSFKRNIYPVFKEYGINDLAQAMIIYRLNTLQSIMHDVHSELEKQ